jgi:hypothetical protein
MTVASYVLNIVLILTLAFVARIYFTTDAIGTDYGSFINAPPKVSVDENGRDVTLLEDFGYKDRRNTVWITQKGYVSNGASIPQLLWSIVGSPLTGKYRYAAFIHDAACDAQEHPPEDVHRAFYEACRCAGVSEREAKILYTGVLSGCPKWQLVPRQEERAIPLTTYRSEERTREYVDPVTGEKKTATYTMQVLVSEERVVTITRMVAESTPTPPLTEGDIEEIVKYISEQNPSLEQIQSWTKARGGSEYQPR